MNAEKNIKLDLDDRPQKSPARLRDRLRSAARRYPDARAQGGLHDYQAFLHEAGHALHYWKLRSRASRTRSATSRATTR